jgi:hypothetical protein
MAYRKRLAALLVAGLAPTGAWAEEPDHAEREHRLIRILETRVHPREAKAARDDAIGWLNYSSQRARVSFDASVAEHLTCRAPGGFRLEGERLATPAIQSTQFVSLCNLAPGRYAYRVELAAGVGGGGAALAKLLEGTIEVSE